ncbi:MAG: hypothetical protein ABIG89_01975 [Candidatus Woesearchaeota archaeon]
MSITKKITTFTTLLVITLLIFMPVSFALSINPDTVKADVDKDSASAAIKWQTDEKASGILRYGKSTEQISTIPETGAYKQDHSVLIDNLELGQKYFYTVESSDGVVTAKLTGWNDFTTILGPVKNAAAESIKSATAKIIWNSLKNAKKYNIYIAEINKNTAGSEGSAGDYKLSDTVIYKQVEIGNLKPNTKYKVKIAGVDALEREGLFSDEIEFTTKQEKPEISFIQVLYITKNSATVRWNTNIPTSSRIKYDKDSTLDLLAESKEEVTEHSIKLDNLQEASTYFFKIISGEEIQVDFTTKPLVESETISFKTLSNDAALEFVEISETDIKEQAATIRWRTNIETVCGVYYSIDDSFSSSKTENKDATEHSIILDDLLSGITYYYKIRCTIQGTQESEVKSFTTLGGEEGSFLTLDPLPQYSVNTLVNITGKTKKGSKLYIFLNDDPVAKVQMVVNKSTFNEKIILNSVADQDNIDGKNIIKVLSWDPAMKKDTKSVYTIVDISRPLLKLNELPDFTNEQTLNISGIAEANASIEIFVNNQSKGKLIPTINGTFSSSVNLGNLNNTISVVAIDNAGNKEIVEKLIVVDRLAPKINILTALKAETHFKILTINGETEPNSKLYITNYGEHSGCEDVEWIRNYGECTSYIGKNNKFPGTLVSLDVDPLGILIGNTVEISADENGKFTVRIPLHIGSGLKMTGMNKIIFLAEDTAGNVGKHQITINYKPGCPDWQINIGDIQSYPFNLYTKDFTDNNVEGSAFIPIEYLGPGTPRNIRVDIHKDINSIHESIFGNTGEVVEQEDGTDMITIRTPKFSQFDPTTRKVFVYVPVTINRFSGSIKTLPDQMNVYLNARISYRSDEAGYYSGTSSTYTGSNFGQYSNYGSQPTGYATCDVYPVISYSIQKPLDYTKFLTPEMINQTIKFLDKTIDITKKISGYVQKAALYTMIGCGAMVAYNYLSAAFKPAGGALATAGGGNGQCSPVEEEMQTTYWLCDRILCPNVPSKCEDKDWKKSGYMDGDSIISEDEWKARGTTNEQTTHAYLQEYNTANPDAPLTADKVNPINVKAWAEKNKIDYNSGLKANPRIYTYIDDDAGETHTFEYIDIKNREIVDKKAMNTLTREAEGTPLISIRISEADSRASECDMTDQTLVRVRKTNVEDLTPLKGAKRIVSPDYFCMPKPADQLGEPDPSFLGCYSESCPNFDQTKCFWKADMNPPAGLWSSTRCGCLPGIKSHLDNFIKIMEGTKKCMQQALIGEVRGGYCERLFAQFICDIFSELILKSLLGVGSDDYGILGGLGADKGISDFKSNSKKISSQLSQRYGGIVKNKLGLSADQLTNKFCIAAITMDWSVLEGMLNQVVDSIPVEPIAHVEADSRAYGYDPFNGRMNIGYSVYLGLVPGGRTQTEMYLECDPSYPNAMCKAGERKPIPRSFRQLDKNSPAIDENIVFVDQGALSWYNKIVLVLKYELGGETKTEVIEKPINKKGDLAFGCTFSVTQGITCQSLALQGQEGGVVEVFPVGAGSYLSPKTNTFYPNNKVNLLLKLKNQFKDPAFYVRLNFDDSRMNPVEYKIPGAGSGENAGAEYLNEQFYNLWLGTIGTDGLSLGSADKYNMNINFELDKSNDASKQNNRFSNGELDIKLEGAEKAVLTIYPQIRTENNQYADLKPFTCEIWDSKNNKPDIEQKYPLYKMAVRQNGNLVSKDGTISTAGSSGTAGTISADNSSEATASGTINSPDNTASATAQVTMQHIIDEDYEERLLLSDGLYSRCLIKGDRLLRQSLQYTKTVDEVKGDDVVVIKSISATVIQKQEYSHITPSLKIISGTKQLQREFTESGKAAATGSQTMKTIGVTLTLLRDTNNNGQGDTPLLYEGRPQQFKFTYYVKEASKTNFAPTVDLIEPIEQYVNDDKDLWIGANIQDDRNIIKDVKLRIVNSNSKESCETMMNVNEEMEVIVVQEKNTCGVYEVENYLNDLAAPSFLRLKINLQSPPASNFFKSGKLDYYTITYEVGDGESKNPGRANKGFRLASRQGAYSYESAPIGVSSRGAIVQTSVGGNIVCLGSEACPVWIGPNYPSEIIMDPNTPQQQQFQDIVPGQYGAQNIPPSTAQQQQYDTQGQQWNYDPNTDYSKPFENYQT